MSSTLTFIILGIIAVLVLAAVFSTTFAVGLQEASDPNHSKAENLSAMEKEIVDREQK